MGVDVVTLLKVLQHVVDVYILTFRTHLRGSSLCSYHRLGRHEYLEFRVREYGGSDVPSVHYDALVLSEFAELPVHEVTHFRYGRDRADLAGHSQRPDLLFDASVADVCAAFSEMKVKIFHRLFKSGHVNCTVICDESVLNGE